MNVEVRRPSPKERNIKLKEVLFFLVLASNLQALDLHHEVTEKEAIMAVYTSTMTSTAIRDRTLPTETDYKVFHHAYYALLTGFVALPLIAGVDKFFNQLVDWTLYLSPVFPNMLGISASTFMLGVGVIEIVAGIGMAIKPKIFAFVVCAWLLSIVVNLAMLGMFYDVALRDVGLAVGAFALGRLALIHEHHLALGHKL